MNNLTEFRIEALINHFYTDIPCKIVRSFNGDDSKQLNRKFKEYHNKEELLIILGLNKKDKKIYDYFYCNNDNFTNNLVIFYNIERLNLFIDILNSNGLNYSKEEILQIPCTYNHKRPILETLIIAMLYGNILPCNSLYLDESPFHINDPLFKKNSALIALQESYKLFLRTVSTNKDNYTKELEKNLNRHTTTINNIEKKQHEEIKKYENEKIRQNLIRKKIYSIKQRINNSTGSEQSKENKKKILNRAIQHELYKKI